MQWVVLHWFEVCGYIAALLTFITFQMKTMIPLRIVGISANFFFIIYGSFGHIYPALVLHAALLPLNSIRLYQMLQLVGKVKAASQGDLNMNWLKPFMNKRRANAGEVLFRKGDLASSMFYSVTGRYRLVEIAVDLGPGEVIGEVGLITPNNTRTLTLECVEDGELLTITYAQVKQLYFQNPKFGFYFLQLISQRLFRDIARLEERVGKPVAT
jgi:CRP/FNR family transcriptional regulator, cyclic AMP receptor protein